MTQQKYFQVIAAFVVGLLFAIGLIVSGMTQPQKVIGFLQINRDWDPSLMFVMLGAIPVHALCYRLIRGRKSPLFDFKFHIPAAREINKPLVVGSALFGFGWALGGFCPGPAVTSLGAGAPSAVLFVIFMVAGMLLQRLYQKMKAR